MFNNNEKCDAMRSKRIKKHAMRQLKIISAELNFSLWWRDQKFHLRCILQVSYLIYDANCFELLQLLNLIIISDEMRTFHNKILNC